jgi:hypothetical protein
METQHDSSSSLPPSTDVPVVFVGTSKAAVSSQKSGISATNAAPIFVRDIIGYLYLCCKATKEHAETRSFNPLANAFAGLSRAMHEVSTLNLKGNDVVDGASLKKILTAAGVSPEAWNIVIRSVGSRKNGREVLNSANCKGEALALGLSEDSSKQLRDVEKRLHNDYFADYEMARLAQLEGDFRTKALKTKPGAQVLLYKIKMGPNHAIPADGFEKYTAAIGWCLGSVFVKLSGFLATLFKSKQLAEQDPAVQTAKNRPWLQPVGTSVKSPTIKSLIKQMASYSVQTDIKPIPDKKGCILELSFTIKPGQIPILLEKLRRQGQS